MDELGIKPKATKPAYVIALTSKAFILDYRIKQRLARFVCCLLNTFSREAWILKESILYENA